MTLQVVTLAEHPEFEDRAHQLDRVWPEFLTHSAITGTLWPNLYRMFPDYQFVVLDGTEIVARGNTMPLVWDGTPEGLPAGVDDVMATATRLAEQGSAPNTLSAVAAIVDPEHQGKGVSSFVIDAMRTLARRQGFAHLIAPVRPNQKHLYPLIPMEHYVSLTRQDGLPFDNWIRVHRRLGAEIVKVAPESMVITGSVHEWETWTGLEMPTSGLYIVAGGLVPVVISREADQGTYREPNVWIVHSVGTP